MKKIYILICTCFFLANCNGIDEESLTLLGNYKARIINQKSSFAMTVFENKGKIMIEAPFDGDVWSSIEIDIRDKGMTLWELEIDKQEIAADISIEGAGYFIEESELQLDYIIKIGKERYNYTLIGNKY